MRSSQAGFVTLAAIVIMIIVGLIGTLLYTSLLGEVQGEIGTRQSVAALGVAEAGANWAGNKLQGGGSFTYTGDTGQAVQGADGAQVGVFDVSVTCADGSAVGSSGCTTQPNSRLVAATGYVPNKTLVLGKRTVQIVATQTSALKFTNGVCSYGTVWMDQFATVNGNVGSEGSATPDTTILQGARVNAAGSQSGSVSVVTSASCTDGCSVAVAGGVNSGQTPGTVCPNRTQVINSFTCPTGSTDVTSSTTISVANGNTSLRDISAPQYSTITFATTGPTDVLNVHVRSVFFDQYAKFVITGGGSVVLTVQGNTYFQQWAQIGVDSLGNTLPSKQLLWESCTTNNSGSTSSAGLGIDQHATVSGVFVVPQGSVVVDQALAASGAIVGNSVFVDQYATFNYDNSSWGAAGGFAKLTSWEDVP